MLIDYLREFLVLADTCNYFDAAEQLYISASTLSKHIQKMEEELGVTLFERNTRKVVLNDAGAYLQEYARKIVDDYDNCCEQLRTLTKRKENSLYIGYTNYIVQYGIIEKIGSFQQAHPEIDIILTEIRPDQIKPTMQFSNYDYVFSAEPFSDDPLLTHAVHYTDSLVLVVSDKNPLAQRKTVSIKELADEKIILHNPPYETASLADYCQSIDLNLNVIMNISYNSTILRLVSQNIGASIMSRHCADTHDKTHCRIVELRPALSFTIYLLKSASNVQTEATKAFEREFVRS